MSTTIPAQGYLGLIDHTPGLPAAAYYDPDRFQLEMARIWYRNWIYVCRSTELAKPRSFRTFEVGDQRLLLVRDEQGAVQAFHNTCRHRGAALCLETHGELRSPGIVCPYHAWTYNLHGELLRTSSKRNPAGFDARDHSLYRVQVMDWQGFIFISLAADPPPFATQFDAPLNRLDAWGLADCVVGHVSHKTIQCNWKIFWENYNECLHCPAVHPKLSQLVPIYGRGLLEERDDPQWNTHQDDDDPKFKGGLRRGAASWSMDGRAIAATFPDVSPEDRKLGAIYVTGLPSMFIVGHVDYVRVVSLLPLGPETTGMTIEYLFRPEALEDPQVDLKSLIEFTNIVLSEDAAICEVNQRGLKALPHERGVVMPEEYVIKQFHDWLNQEMMRA
ncbi:MAG: aromatic ring-hydroxylating dioxygenase subunit alpha [Steroidobacterales bacterium]